MATVRRLTEEGSRLFDQYLNTGAAGAAPLESTSTAGLSVEFVPRVEVGHQTFRNRFEFGKYLRQVLAGAERTKIAHDEGLWNWLALFYFDQLCPPGPDGIRRPLRKEHYLLSSEWSKYYRHLVAAPYILIDLHSDMARSLLHSRVGQHGDFVEQLASRQDIITNRQLLKAVDFLYFDPSRGDGGGPKPGATDRTQPGTLRRLVAVMQQLELTYDLHAMDALQILELLPEEFSPWKPAHLRGLATPRVRRDDSAVQPSRRG